MSSNSSAARTNLTSQEVKITNKRLGEGHFRVALEGTYIGGNRNQQAAACKRFKPKFRSMEQEYFSHDFRIADVAIGAAEAWNNFAKADEQILISRGDIKFSNSGIRYLVEPLIRKFTKFTSNSGWITKDEGWHGEAMEAFSHFTYDHYGGSFIVCDLQGRYRHNSYSKKKSRFELTDPAICSTTRAYGPTDLCEKGIETFFANHVCNQFCNIGRRWKRPRQVTRHFPSCSGTSMFSTTLTNRLTSQNQTRFTVNNDSLAIIQENNYCDSDSSEDSW